MVVEIVGGLMTLLVLQKLGVDPFPNIPEPVGSGNLVGQSSNWMDQFTPTSLGGTFAGGGGGAAAAAGPVDYSQFDLSQFTPESLGGTLGQNVPPQSAPTWEPTYGPVAPVVEGPLGPISPYQAPSYLPQFTNVPQG